MINFFKTLAKKVDLKVRLIKKLSKIAQLYKYHNLLNSVSTDKDDYHSILVFFKRNLSKYFKEVFTENRYFNNAPIKNNIIFSNIYLNSRSYSN